MDFKNSMGCLLRKLVLRTRTSARLHCRLQFMTETLLLSCPHISRLFVLSFQNDSCCGMMIVCNRTGLL